MNSQGGKMGITKKLHNGNHQRLGKRGRHIPRLERPHESSVVAICKSAALGIGRKYFLVLFFRCKCQDRVRKSTKRNSQSAARYLQ